MSISGPTNDVVTLPRDRVNIEAEARGLDGKKLGSGYKLVWTWSSVGPDVKLKDIDKSKLTVSDLKAGSYTFTASVSATKHNRLGENDFKKISTFSSYVAALDYFRKK